MEHTDQQSKKTCEELARELVRVGHMVSILHGGMDIEDRDKVIDMFAQGKTRVLVTTNVLARGIDVMQVSLVINHDVPLHLRATEDSEREPDTETYVHRIGRTARFGRSGVALNLIESDEEMEKLDSILCEINCDSIEISFDKISELDALLKECRRRDEENVRRLGLDPTQLESSGESQSFIPKKHKSHRSHKSHKPKSEGGADAAAPADAAPSDAAAAPAPAAEPAQ